MVPLSLGLATGELFAPPGSAEDFVSAPGRPPPGAFIISIVPLNLGPPEPFMLKPHFWQVVALSEFWAPQLGQNTCILQELGRRARHFVFSSKPQLLTTSGLAELSEPEHRSSSHESPVTHSARRARTVKAIAQGGISFAVVSRRSRRAGRETRNGGICLARES